MLSFIHFASMVLSYGEFRHNIRANRIHSVNDMWKVAWPMFIATNKVNFTWSSFIYVILTISSRFGTLDCLFMSNMCFNMLIPRLWRCWINVWSFFVVKITDIWVLILL